MHGNVEDFRLRKHINMVGRDNDIALLCLDREIAGFLQAPMLVRPRGRAKACAQGMRVAISSMRSRKTAMLGLAGTFALLLPGVASAQDTAHSVPADDGVIDVQASQVPYSNLASPEARKEFIEGLQARRRLSGLPRPATVAEMRRRSDEASKQALQRLRSAFAVEISPEVIGGVQTDVVVPVGGVSPRNRDRVLINAHGGGFVSGARYGGQAEAVPVAGMGGIKVVAVDYRMAPEARFPASSEDVASVYRALLKTYRPENIGIFGCSAGGVVSAQSVAWFQKHGLPKPGAIGIFGAAPGRPGQYGDGIFIGKLLTEGKVSPLASALNYFEGTDPSDVLVSPLEYADVARQYPPSLLISGTRDISLSLILQAHMQLRSAGAEADLHVIEGATHCSFVGGSVDPEVPENRYAWRTIADFFDRHLGRTR